MAVKIGVRYGGQQPKMRDSELIDSTYFGPYHDETFKLQIGDVQSMTFSDTDDGPCYLNHSNRIKYKYDVDSGKTRERDITRPNLIKALKADGMKEPCGSREKLQELSEIRNLPTKFTERVIKEGWAGKPKGAFQLLFERGWINPACIHMYTAKGKDGVSGFSINELMKLQPDFVSEQTLLQYHAHMLGVQLLKSPKCHPEIAGEGVEYGWGLSKMKYCRCSSSDKRSKDAFHELVF